MPEQPAGDSAALRSVLDDLWDKADALDDDGHWSLAAAIRHTAYGFDRTRCSNGHPLGDGSCGCKVNRILWNRRGEDIDEIVIHEPEMVHVEQMNERCWWIGIYLKGEDEFGPLRWSGNFSADSKGRMSFSPQDDDVEWFTDESHEEKG